MTAGNSVGRSAWLAQQLAEFVTGLDVDHVPTRAIDQARYCLQDLVGAAVAGADEPAPSAVRRLARSIGSEGPSGLWFSGRSMSPALAGLANSAAASAIDADDGHRASGGHPGAAIIPAVLAVAEEARASRTATLAAIAIGYEIGVRVAAARPTGSVRTYSTGRWAAFGVAAAAGWLRDLTPDRLAHGLAIAGAQSPDLTAVGYPAPRRTGHMVKEGIPWSVLTGLAAVELAEAGFTGPLALLDHPDDIDGRRLVLDLGSASRRWAIEGVYFKPYACCRWLHAGLDAILALQRQHSIMADDIRGIRIYTFRRAADLVNAAAPDSLESAQFSYPFCLAVAAFDGAKALMPMHPRVLRRAELVALAERVQVEVDPQLEGSFPGVTPGRLEIQTADGSFECAIDHPLGDPENPLGPVALRAKFDALTAGQWSLAERATALDSFWASEDAPIGELHYLLRRAAGQGVAGIEPRDSRLNHG